MKERKKGLKTERRRTKRATRKIMKALRWL
jgi:hypothetical protein